MTVSNEPSVDREFPRRVSASEFAVSDFITNHLINNQPVIIRGCTQNWLACDKWLKEDGSPDFSFLLKQFGKVIFCLLLIHLRKSTCSGYMLYNA